MTSALRSIDNERETIADERIGGIRDNVGSSGNNTLNFRAITDDGFHNNERRVFPAHREPKAGLGRMKMNFGYDRKMRLAAAPERDSWYSDKSSAFCRIVPARVPCFERPGLAR